MASLQARMLGHRAEVFLVASLVAWLAWVGLSPVLTGHPVPFGSHYVVAPLMLLGGIGLGWLGSRSSQRWLLAELLVLVCLLALMVPLYGNARGAVGVQVVALTSLMALRYLPAAKGRPLIWLRVVLVALILLAGMLAKYSDAAALLVVPLAALCVLVVSGVRAPGIRRLVVGAGSVVVWAATCVVVLGSLSSWPEWLSASSVLSKARHVLWGDALTLWAQNPVAGGGVGSFVEWSELASKEPSLEMVHSSVLQVGSELGLVGAALFATVAAAALFVALKGSASNVTVAGAAWACLGVHSTIDHLFDHPVVVVLMGAVLGWSRGAPHTNHLTPSPSRGGIDHNLN